LMAFCEGLTGIRVKKSAIRTAVSSVINWIYSLKCVHQKKEKKKKMNTTRHEFMKIADESQSRVCSRIFCRFVFFL
jgi:hypothetical protein